MISINNKYRPEAKQLLDCCTKFKRQKQVRWDYNNTIMSGTMQSYRLSLHPVVRIVDVSNNTLRSAKILINTHQVMSAWIVSPSCMLTIVPCQTELLIFRLNAMMITISNSTDQDSVHHTHYIMIVVYLELTPAFAMHYMPPGRLSLRTMVLLTFSHSTFCKLEINDYDMSSLTAIIT